jgi:hypothetical protein
MVMNSEQIPDVRPSPTIIINIQIKYIHLPDGTMPHQVLIQLHVDKDQPMGWSNTNDCTVVKVVGGGGNDLGNMGTNETVRQATRHEHIVAPCSVPIRGVTRHHHAIDLVIAGCC